MDKMLLGWTNWIRWNIYILQNRMLVLHADYFFCFCDFFCFLFGYEKKIDHQYIIVINAWIPVVKFDVNLMFGSMKGEKLNELNNCKNCYTSVILSGNANPKDQKYIVKSTHNNSKHYKFAVLVLVTFNRSIVIPSYRFYYRLMLIFMKWNLIDTHYTAV